MFDAAVVYQWKAGVGNTANVVFSLQEHFRIPRLSRSLCSILENKWKGPRRLSNLRFCCAECFGLAGLITLLLGMLQVPIAQLGDSLVLDRMPHALGKLLFRCCVLMFAAECWGGVWEYLGSTSSCLGMSELNSQKQICTELALL